jgi:TRAP-type mannitol/chloroaromatic compound transport system permease small subunit
MNCCCNDDGQSPVEKADASAWTSALSRKGTLWQRIVTLVQWCLPVVTLALVPKCPVCMAAYVLLFTGVGLSLAVASTIRWMMIALSIIALAFLLLRGLRRVGCLFNKRIDAKTLNPHVF